MTLTTDPLGQVTLNEWRNDRPYQSATIAALGNVPGQTLNLLSRTTDAFGITTTYTSDDRGNMIKISNPIHETGFGYDNGMRTSATDGNGNTTRYTYEAHGWLETVTDPLNAVTRYGYDEGGNPKTVTNPLQAITQYQYDRLGRQTMITYADGGKAEVLYDGAGNLLETVDPADAVTRYKYDSRGRVTEKREYPSPGDAQRALVTPTDPAIVVYVTKYKYDAVGQPSEVTDAAGKKWAVTYDGAGRQLSTTDPLNHTTAFTYDATGNMLSTKDANNNVASAAYDALNRRTQTTIPQDSTNTLSESTVYDALGRKTKVRDGLGNTTSFYYDAAGRLVTVADPLGFWTHYEYDGAGNRTAVTDAQRRVTQFVYDKANRLIEEKRPDGTSVHIRYDLLGRAVEQLNARGQATVYAYDNRDRLQKVTYLDGRTVTYQYDLNGRRTSITDWNGTTSYQYNMLGWLTATDDFHGNRVSYGYDQVGRRTQMTLQSTSRSFGWTYAYDDAGRLTSLRAPEFPLANTFSYDGGNRLTLMQFGNGDTTEYQYSQADEVKKILAYNAKYPKPSGLMDLDYTYDKAGRRTSITGDGATNYGYDASSRLVSVSAVGTTTNKEYYYDLVGNRHTVVNRSEVGSAYTYVYDAANRLLEEFGPGAGGSRYHQSYLYDEDGNQIRTERDSSNVVSYEYNQESQLIRVTSPVGGTTAYGYDGDGKRVRMDDPTGTTLFIYDGTEVLAEADVTGSIVAVYTRMPGDGRLISQWRSGESYWYHLDGLTSTRVMTDESGSIKNKYRYDEFGNPSQSNTVSVFNRYTFTGQAWDAAAGLYNYKARYYSPSIGRFLTQDAWKGTPWLPWTQNLYVYVGNNPVNHVDPSGHCLWDLCIAEGTAVYLAGAALVTGAAAMTPAGQELLGRAGEAFGEGMTSASNWVSNQAQAAWDAAVVWMANKKGAPSTFKQLGQHIANYTGASTGGFDPDPNKKDPNAKNHWWKEIKTFAENIRKMDLTESQLYKTLEEFGKENVDEIVKYLLDNGIKLTK